MKRNDLNPKSECRNPIGIHLFRHSREGGNPHYSQYFQKQKQILACARMTTTQSGFTMILVMAAFLVLFTTVSLIKVGTIADIKPDLRRIGININNPGNQNLAGQDNGDSDETSTSLVDSENNNPLTVASSSLDESGADDAEGDNPAYIE